MLPRGFPIRILLSCPAASFDGPLAVHAGRRVWQYLQACNGNRLIAAFAKAVAAFLHGGDRGFDADEFAAFEGGQLGIELPLAVVVGGINRVAGTGGGFTRQAHFLRQRATQGRPLSDQLVIKPSEGVLSSHGLPLFCPTSRCTGFSCREPTLTRTGRVVPNSTEGGQP